MCSSKFRQQGCPRLGFTLFQTWTSLLNNNFELLKIAKAWTLILNFDLVFLSLSANMLAVVECQSHSAANVRQYSALINQSKQIHTVSKINQSVQQCWCWQYVQHSTSHVFGIIGEGSRLCGKSLMARWSWCRVDRALLKCFGRWAQQRFQSFGRACLWPSGFWLTYGLQSSDFSSWKWANAFESFLRSSETVGWNSGQCLEVWWIKIVLVKFSLEGSWKWQGTPCSYWTTLKGLLRVKATESLWDLSEFWRPSKLPHLH